MPALIDFADEPRREIGRRLNAHLSPEHEARDGERPQEIVVPGVRALCHARARLGAERLDDHFLNVAAVAGAQRQHRLDAFATGLADADQKPRREGNVERAGRLDRRETDRGVLVRRAEMNAAALRQPR